MPRLSAAPSRREGDARISCDEGLVCNFQGHVWTGRLSRLLKKSVASATEVTGPREVVRLEC